MHKKNVHFCKTPNTFQKYMLFLQIMQGGHIRSLLLRDNVHTYYMILANDIEDIMYYIKNPINMAMTTQYPARVISTMDWRSEVHPWEYRKVLDGMWSIVAQTSTLDTTSKYIQLTEHLLALLRVDTPTHIAYNAQLQRTKALYKSMRKQRSFMDLIWSAICGNK